MLDVGILREEERVELLRGDLVRKVTIGDRHRVCVIRLTELLAVRFSGRAAVQVQNPVVVLDDSEPEPDLALLARNEASVGGRACPVMPIPPTSLRLSKSPIRRATGIRVLSASSTRKRGFVNIGSSIWSMMSSA